MKRILVTGGSGFIGTNIVEYYRNIPGNVVLNLDIVVPKNNAHLDNWRKVDLLDYKALENAIDIFQPEFVLHLAARTDLNEVRDITGYDANITGVNNLVKILRKCKAVKRVIFTSSMLVCKVGYNPTSYDDYFPTTLYGESKVLTEKIVKEADIVEFEWCIIRPTSIWGPWFGEPYRNFFDTVLAKKYFLLKGKVSRKTFGFVGNSIYQIDSLLNAERTAINKRTFYIGDSPPYDINEWALEIGKQSKINFLSIPRFVVRMAGYFGDLLKMVGVKFPMTSFRYKNMTTDNVVVLLKDTEAVVKEVPYSMEDGVRITLAWLSENQKV